LEIDKTIEKIKIIKSALDTAFDEGRIDLDRISAGLESAVADLEAISCRQKRKDHRSGIQREISSLANRAERRPSLLVEDYR
jgi:hypothetical protein